MNKSSSTFYLLWSGAIVLGVIACVFVLIFAACSDAAEPTETAESGPVTVTVNGSDLASASSSAAASESADSGTQTQSDGTESASQTETAGVSTVTVSASGARLAQTADAGIDYQNRFIFLGDSTTYGLKAYGCLSGGTSTTQVWTPSSGTLTLSYQSIATIVYPPTGSEITIFDAAEQAQPEYMLITLGVNGVSFMDEENFKREYTDLVTHILEVSPDTRIILNSIYPVTEDYQYSDQINNTKITAANVWVEEIAEDCGVHFLNSYEVIVGADGYLPQSLCNGDGIHLNADGYNTMLTYLRTHAWP